VNEERATGIKDREAILRQVILLCATLVAETASAQVPSFIFATQAGGTNQNEAHAVAVDSAGNSFVTGFFTGTTTFGTTNLTSAGAYDIFVAKYDPNGRLAWVRQAGGTNVDSASGIAVDAAGNCYVTGTFGGPASFGPTNSVEDSTNTLFLVKYDGLGNVAWVAEAAALQGIHGAGVVVDAGGDCYVTGSFAGTAYFGNITLTDTGTYGWGRLFLAKYDPHGNVMWATQDPGNPQSSGGVAVALDSQQNVYVTGDYGYDLSTAGVYLAKYDGNGGNLWTFVAPSSANSESSGEAVALDSSNNIFVIGGFRGTLAIGGATITSPGPYGVFLAKYSPSPNLQWLNPLGGSNSFGTGVAGDQSGNCFVTGYFSGSATLGTTNLTSFGYGSGFVAKYDGLGDLVWVMQAAGSQYVATDGIAWRQGGGEYVAGRFLGEAVIGDTVLVSSNSACMFLARVDEIPILAVSNSPNGVVLSWPTNQLGFTLEKATNSLPASQWSTVTNIVSVSGDHYVVTDQVSSTSSFYRLWKP
jgi:hypothetical protein